ncbi:hypothetical protein QBC44DRAFT_372435 [Cladorrhinum sp. PSN332]|nr:hypothetical protein QBC44DRAFT_372435 [Cladorrhinum sp. PSN332]
MQPEQKWLTLRHKIGLGMHCAATDRRAEAARAFIAVANGYQDIRCGSSCVGELTEMLFRALAAMQENKMVESILRLSLLIDKIKNGERYRCCCLFAANYQEHVLLIAGHFYLATIFDKCGMDPALGDSCRKDALAVMEGSASSAELLDENYLPLSNKDDMYLPRWLQSCVSYAKQRKAGEIASTVRAMDFPFEIFLLPDVTDDRDFFLL